MKLISLSMSGYRQFLEGTTLDFREGLTGICGPNGVGKSKIIEAVGFAFYGPDSRILPSGDHKRDVPSAADPRGRTQVDLVVELRGQSYHVSRTMTTASVRLLGHQAPLADTPSAVKAKMIELLRLTPDAFVGTFVAQQNHIAGLQTLGDRVRQVLVNRLIGITVAEKALTISQQEHRDRASVHTTLQTSIKKTVAQATEELDSARDAFAKTQDEEACRIKIQNTAKDTLEQARERRDTLKTAANDVTALTDQLNAVKSHRQSQLTSREGAVERAAAAATAGEQVAAAFLLLDGRSRVEDALARHDRLAEMANLRAQATAARRDLADRIEPDEAALAKATSAIARLASQIQIASDRLTELVGLHSAAKQEMEHADETAKRLEEHKATAVRLGRTGTCVACGQAFGEHLEKALKHYTDEATAERERQIRAKAHMDAIEHEKTQLSARLEKLRGLQGLHIERQGGYETLPGEARRVRTDLKDIEQKLAAIPETDLGIAYDLVAHERTRAAKRAIDAADLSIPQLEPQAGKQAAIKTELNELDVQLAQLDIRERELQARLDAAQNAASGLDDAEQAFASADAAWTEDSNAVQAAYGVKVRADAEVTQATTALMDAEENERSLGIAARRASVSEYTQQAMAQMLLEITQEARPVLEELISDWSRALFGNRFRSIELTEHYTIRADNGSGKHEIGHFSGGEQTLLALMLRVAISLFCHQRAGFDKSFLILDEIFGNQDTERRALLLQFLEEIRPRYHQILLVNHVDDVTELLDNIIDVRPTGRNTSAANYRELRLA